MDDTRLGGLFRAVRIQSGMRQEDVSRESGVSQSRISMLERGHASELTLAEVQAVANVLEIRLDWSARWRGGELDRLLDARHAALHEALAQRLARFPDWETAAEVSFSIWGERGVIDRMTYHRPTGALGVFELKSEISSAGGLVGQTDRYRRLAPTVAAERGWSVTGPTGCWVLIADTDMNRRRLRDHVGLLRGAFPADGRQLREWLRDPRDPISGLGFLAYPHEANGKWRLSTARRVRVRRRGDSGR